MVFTIRPDNLIFESPTVQHQPQLHNACPSHYTHHPGQFGAFEVHVMWSLPDQGLIMNTHPPDVIEQNKETTRMKEVLVVTIAEFNP